MKKKFLKVATALTIMGGVAFSAEGTTAKAELVKATTSKSGIL